MQLDKIDRRLLNCIQTEFPLTREPFADLGQRLGIGVDEVIERILQLKRKGVIRMVGPVLDSRSLGYHTTLVAMKLAVTDLEKAVQVIVTHPGIGHGYEREHQFNLWFTLALPPASGIEKELKNLTHATGAKDAFSLPATKLFKIGAYFDMDDNEQNAPAATRNTVLSEPAELSRNDRLIISELQQDLALIPTPFNAMADRVGMDIEQFLAGCRSLQQHGIIRRFSASINHKKAGFTANAMSCWVAPPDKIDAAGQKLATLKEISHCYERVTNKHWHYNLFAMIHGYTREVCRKIAEKISSETGLTDYALLYSTREFKKTRVKYLV